MKTDNGVFAVCIAPELSAKGRFDLMGAPTKYREGLTPIKGAAVKTEFRGRSLICLDRYDASQPPHAVTEFLDTGVIRAAEESLLAHQKYHRAPTGFKYPEGIRGYVPSGIFERELSCGASLPEVDGDC